MNAFGAKPSKWIWIGYAWAALCFVVAGSGCSSTGACEGTDGVFGHSYCYDDWTEDECDDYDAQQVNGANWTFHSGDTCADL